MKSKIKNIWCFIIWLFNDIKLQHYFVPVNTFLIIVSFMVPTPYSTYILLYILIAYTSCALYLLIYLPLKYSYKKFKDEQREIFKIIKGDD
jgi:hypothetical protein